MFPIDFLRLAANSEICIFLKNGEMLKGILESTDTYMNLKLKKCSLSTKGGQVQKISEVYVRGFEVKNVQLPDIVLDKAASIELNYRGFAFVERRTESCTRSLKNSRAPFTPPPNTRMVVKEEAEEWTC